MRALALIPLALSLTALAQDAPQQPTTTLRTGTTIVLVPTSVQLKGQTLYTLKPEQFVVEDNGVPQTIKLDEDTDRLGLSLVVAVQCSRAAVMEYAKLQGLASLIEGLAGGAPRQVAIVSYGSSATVLQDFTTDINKVAHAIASIQPCDDGGAATLDAVNTSNLLFEGQSNDYRRAILLISETRDHGSQTKPAELIAALGRTNTVVDAVTFSPEKTELLNNLKYGGGAGPLPLLFAAVAALKKNAAHQLANMTGGEYINFTTRQGFENGLHTLSNHLHNYYLLSFSANNATPGLHQIRVTIPDYPNAKIRHRLNYWAAPR